MKEVLKVAVFSSLPNVRDEICGIFENPEKEFRNYRFHVEDMKYEIFIEELIKIALRHDSTKASEKQKIREELIYEFMMQLCHFNPHYILFGPMIPCGFNEFNILKAIIVNLDMHMDIYQKKHHFIKHQIKFIPIFAAKGNDYPKELENFNCCLFESIGDSLFQNKEIIKNYFYKIDKEKMETILSNNNNDKKLLFV